MKYWWKYIKPYLPYFIIGPICMIVEVIGEVVLPKLLSTVINRGTDGTLTVSLSVGILFAMIGVAVLMMAGGVGGAYFGAKASVNFATDLRADAYRAVERYSFANIDKFSTGSLVTRMTNDVTQVQNFVNMLLRMALRAPGMLIAALMMAITLKPSLAVVFAVTIPLMLLSILGIILVGFRRFTKLQSKIDELNSTVQENITNVRVVKSFVREEYETKKFSRANNNLKEVGMAAMKVMIFMEPVTTLIMYATTIAVLWFGSGFVIDGGMAVGDLSAFVVYVNQILMSILMVTMLLMTSSRAIASAKRIRQVIDEVPEIDDSHAAAPDRLIEAGGVEFRDVSFRYYKNRDEYVLKHITLSVAPGSTMGIIGSTGCGKSTLVSMICRLYDPDTGAVLIDGVNVKDYSLRHLRDGVGMVLQKNTLFSGTIAENLRWGNESATDEQVRRAAEMAQADKFVSSFPKGYDTLIEQGGTNVSGGQKQRLCIARALLKHPKILILDDSTSAVDTATEKQIRTALTEDFTGVTKIIIAQRISSVMEADQIAVMNEGEIVAVGTHEELLGVSPEYREIYESQMGGEEHGKNA
ncbi:MAG: ABC transporter ATP-binding protein [Eubacteriales bacterium]|nr:ABC transporter ATP-binding protein [Eubacteriales bacterium]